MPNSYQGLTSDEMRAVQGNLLSATPSPSLADPDLSGFDIAVVGLGFHHFDDPSLAARRLAERLKPGGVLLILDFLPHAHGDANAHPAVHTVRHAGFSEEAVREMYEGAGVGNDFKLQSKLVFWFLRIPVFEKTTGMSDRGCILWFRS